MGKKRFLQFSDLHFGSKLTGGRLRLPEEKRAVRQGEFRKVVDDLTAAARENDVDAVLLPGDLFDEERADGEAVGFLVDRLNRLAPIPVFVAAGNHDPVGSASPWNREFLSGRGLAAWGDHIHVFPPDRWRETPIGDGWSVVGRSCGTGLEGRRLFDPPLPAAEHPRRILVAHGSEEGSMPPNKSAAHPFRIEEIRAAGTIYAALGHFHARQEFREAGGRILAAYAGSPVARGLDETGPRAALLVTVDEDGAVGIETLPADPRRIVVQEVDLTGVSHAEAVNARLVEAVRRASPEGRDLVFLRAVGLVPPDLSVDLGEEAAGSSFHVVLDASEVRPNYDIEEILRGDSGADTLEARFVRALVEEMDAERDPRRKRLLEEAIGYGLDALRLGKVRMRHVD